MNFLCSLTHLKDDRAEKMTTSTRREHSDTATSRSILKTFSKVRSYDKYQTLILFLDLFFQ